MTRREALIVARGVLRPHVAQLVAIAKGTKDLNFELAYYEVPCALNIVAVKGRCTPTASHGSLTRGAGDGEVLVFQVEEHVALAVHAPITRVRDELLKGATAECVPDACSCTCTFPTSLLVTLSRQSTGTTS